MRPDRQRRTAERLFLFVDGDDVAEVLGKGTRPARQVQKPPGAAQPDPDDQVVDQLRRIGNPVAEKLVGTATLVTAHVSGAASRSVSASSAPPRRSPPDPEHRA